MAATPQRPDSEGAAAAEAGPPADRASEPEEPAADHGRARGEVEATRRELGDPARERKTSSGQEPDAVQRARVAAAQSLIAVNDRLGVKTDRQVYEVAGVEPEAPRRSRPGLVRRLAQAVRRS